jgi:DNA repair protein RadC
MGIIHKNYKLPVQKCIDGEDINQLSDIELLAIILGTGTREKDVLELSSLIIKKMGGLRGILNSGIREIAEEKGIGLKKSIKIHAAFELGKRAIGEKRPFSLLNSPAAVWEYLLPDTAGFEKEVFTALIINNKNTLLKKKIISIGTVTEAIVHPREVFREAIREGGSGLIVTHNHPSGNLSPSKQDIETTGRLIEAGKIVGIPLVDHIILTTESFYSMKENGYIT